MYLKIIYQTSMRIECFNNIHFFLQSPSPLQGKVWKKRFIASWRKTKVPYQGSWRKVFEQTYSQQTDNKEQTGTLENLFSIQSLKISFIGVVIVLVMCITIYYWGRFPSVLTLKKSKTTLYRCSYCNKANLNLFGWLIEWVGRLVKIITTLASTGFEL